jgi:transcriptional regulator with XRE-family HTH domain
MQSKDTRVFTVVGKQVMFDAQIFNKNFEIYRRKKLKIGELVEQLAEKLNVSMEVVHNWRFRKNGPSDVEMLIIIAKTLGLSDWTLLTTEIDGGNTMTQLTERQKDAAKRIYDVCIWFLSEFSNTDGFNDYWCRSEEAGSKDPEEDSCELVQKKMDKVGMVLDQEYFVLHGHEIYDEFCEFTSEELTDTYNGKLSYAYRFEAIPDGHPTTSDDYDRAMKVLNAIIDKHL